MYKISKLANGIRVLTVSLKDRNSVGLGIWAKVGGRFEKKNVNGVSHFLEHMLFKGTKHRSTRKIKEDVEGSGGLLNAFTGEESTCYFVKILRKYAARAYDVLADMVNFALLDKKEFDKERGVILEEIKMYLDLPSHHVHELMGGLLWSDQPLGRPIAGDVESVSGISRADMRAYMEKHYHPGNLLVVFCGEVEHDEVCAMTEKLFRGRKPKESSRFEAAISAQSDQRFHFINKRTEQMHFVIGFHSLAKNHPDRYKLALLNVILGANMSSRLFEEVREKRGLAYEIRSGLSFFEDAGAVTISAGVEPKNAPLAVRVIMRELNRLKSKWVSSAELRRAKDYFIGQFYLGLEDTLDHMLWVGDRMVYKNELPNHREIVERIRAVSSEDIQALSRKLFKTEGVNFSLIGSYEGRFEGQIREECCCG